MLGKVVGGFMGSRIAERAGQSGALGASAGIVASRFVRRSPIGALVVGGAWLGHKLYKRNQERKFEAAALNAKPAKVVAPDDTASLPPNVTDSSEN
ncbi:MAG: hypothetical protein R3E11_08065 [Sphingobium sp.]|nr:hypothetical protein [Sphingobium sp.]MCP5397906.1 hypothetical protein [Sphingomonas sp.]